MKHRAVVSLLLALLAVGMVAQGIFQDREVSRKRSEDKRAQQAAPKPMAQGVAERVNALRQVQPQAQLWQQALRRNPELAKVVPAQTSQATLCIQTRPRSRARQLSACATAPASGS